MTVLNYVEDYILFIAGNSGEPLISLARYDKPIVASFAAQILRNVALTDKQAQLALKLVQKYRKQISGLKQQVCVADTLNFKLGIRQIDRNKRAWIDKNKIVLKFPYETEIINQIKKYQQTSNGNLSFQYEQKQWQIAITEDNVNWLCTVAKSLDINLDNEIVELFDKILAVEKVPHVIELTFDPDHPNKLMIVNAATSLITYIEQQLGGFDITNLLTLVDNASWLGYQVNENLLKKLRPHFTPLQQRILTNKHIDVAEQDFDLDQILVYARKTSRLPVYIYGALNKSSSDDIVNVTVKTDLGLQTPKLFVSLTGILIGPKRQAWVSLSEKVVITNQKL